MKLTPRGEEILKDLESHVEETGAKITKARKLEMTSLAECLDQYEKAVEGVRVNGQTQISPNGYRQVSPEFANMNTLHAQIIRHCDKLGFYPKGLGVKEEEKEGTVDAKTRIAELRKVGS